MEEMDAIPRGNDHGRSATTPLAAAAAVVDGSFAPRRRRTGGGATVVKKAALLMLISGGAAILVLQYRPSSSTAALITRMLSTVQLQQQQLPALPESLTATLQNVPRLSRDLLEGTKATAVSIKSFTAESAELAWEKSEDAFHQLRTLEEEEGGESRENPWERALEGLEGIFHLRKRANNEGGGESRVGNNNLRKEGRNNNKQQQRNMKRETSSKGASNNNRRVKVDHQANEPSVVSTNQEGETIPTNHGLMAIFSSSPLAAPLLAFCTVLFLAASLIMNSGRRAHNQEGRNRIILDENEAEIVEFYEKEMECGTLQQMVPLFQDVKEGNENHLLKRQSSCELWMNSERNASDSSLTRHHSGDIRESKGDLYYSRVFQDIEILNYEDDEEVDSVQEQEEPTGDGEQEEPIVDGDNRCDQECQITLLDNLSSLTEEDEGEADAHAHSTAAASTSPQSQPVAVEEDETCFESAQSKVLEESHSPPSSCSSISSLTSDGYDIEAPSFEGPSNQGDAPRKVDEGEASSPLYGSSTIVMPGPDQDFVATRTKNLSLTDYSEYHVSPSSATPPRSNVFQDRRRSLVKRERKMERCVSFSPEVKVREIPREQKRRNELSSESYLYIMLFTVAIAIAVFSLVPAHPSLSPMNSMTGGDILQRAETILSSQWEVEL